MLGLRNISLFDGEECFHTGTSPLNPDTDGEGIPTAGVGGQVLDALCGHGHNGALAFAISFAEYIFPPSG